MSTHLPLYDEIVPRDENGDPYEVPEALYEAEEQRRAWSLTFSPEAAQQRAEDLLEAEYWLERKVEQTILWNER